MFALVTALASARPPVAVIEDAAWSPGDPERDGAAELGVLLQLAQLQQAHSAVGLVGVGDRRGAFQEGTRRALEFAVRQGAPVVRLSREARPCLELEGDLFIDGGNLSPQRATEILAYCLDRFGALPKARHPARPTPEETSALQTILRRYQAEFTTQQATRLAAR